MNIVGISGLAGAGKDEVAKVLVGVGYERVALADPLKRIARDLYGFSEEQLWGPSEKRNIPDPRWPKGHLWDSSSSSRFRPPCKRCGVSSPPDDVCVPLSPREALQILGTEVGRLIHPETWARYLLHVATELLGGGKFIPAYSPEDGLGLGENYHHIGPGPKGVVVPDVRFPNEADKGAEELTHESVLEWLEELSAAYVHCESVYQSGLRRGIPKEIARLPIPVGRYSRMRASANLRNWLGFLTLRQAPNAQSEIRQYANALHDELSKSFPRTMGLFDEGRK